MNVSVSIIALLLLGVIVYGVFSLTSTKENIDSQIMSDVVEKSNSEMLTTLAEVCNSRQKKNSDDSCTTCLDFTKVSADKSSCESPICKLNEVIEFNGECIACGIYRVADS